MTSNCVQLWMSPERMEPLMVFIMLTTTPSASWSQACQSLPPHIDRSRVIAMADFLP